jgi:fused signal recognition particle receptor
MDQQWLLIVLLAVAAEAVVAVLLVRWVGRRARPEKRTMPSRGAPRAELGKPGKAEPARVAEKPRAVEKPAERERPAAWSEGLARTRGGFVARLSGLLGRKEIDAALLEQIEEVLLTADIGPRTAHRLFEAVKARLDKEGLRSADALWTAIREESLQILSLPSAPVDVTRAKPFVLLVIGVNGAGKTTTIGKLAARFVGDGRKVLLAAGDTFRAAAVEQLEVWAGRVGADILKGKDGGDPSSVIFDAVKRAREQGYDVVIADTAGRLQTKTNLMEELQKIRRVVQKLDPAAPHETLLVLDSTNGQNAISQAQLFKEAMGITGIVLTKLDGTAKGGVILGICDDLRIPVRFVGVGEKVGDLREFDPSAFVEALYQQEAA